MTWLYRLVWCLVAVGLLVFDRRLWTKPPGPVDDLDRVGTHVELGTGVRDSGQRP